MSFVDLDAPSAYDVLKLNTPGDRTSRDRWAIIIRTFDFQNTPVGWAVLVPDAGEKPHDLLRMYREREQQSRVKANEREQEFQDSLLAPHHFMLADRKTGLCYCGQIASNEIHTDEPEDELNG